MSRVIRAAGPGLLIFVLALGLRLAWVATLADQINWPDELEFVQIARHLATGDGYVATSYRANPVFPTVLALVFRTVGENYLAARVAQSVFGALTCVVVYRTAALALGPAVGILSGVLLAVYLPHIYLSGVFYVECLLTLLCTLVVHFGLRSLRRPGHVGAAVLCGVTLGAAALTRTIALVYLPFLCAALVYAAWPSWRRPARAGAAIALAAAVVILPWTARNYTVYGRFLLVSSGFGTKLWQGNNALAAGGPDDRELFWDTADWTERLRELPEAEQRALGEEYAAVDRAVRAAESRTGDRFLATDAVLGPLALRYMAQHPGHEVVLFLRKLQTFFSAFSKTLTAPSDVSTRNQVLASLAYYPILTLSLVGAALGLGRRRELCLVYLFIGSMTFVYGVLNTCTRFRLPLDPYLIVFAALALVEAWRWVRAEGARRFRPVRWLGSAALVVSGLAIGLLAVEGGIRLWVATVEPNILVLDDAIGWTHRASARRSVTTEGVPAVLQTNALGLRGPLHVGPTTHRRILVLGDSLTEGLQVSDDELFSVLLERRRADLEIANAGVSGYGTVQELLAAERIEPIVHPDLSLVMVFGGNDLTDNVMPFDEGIGRAPGRPRGGSSTPSTGGPSATCCCRSRVRPGCTGTAWRPTSSTSACWPRRGAPSTSSAAGMPSPRRRSGRSSRCSSASSRGEGGS